MLTVTEVRALIDAWERNHDGFTVDEADAQWRHLYRGGFKARLEGALLGRRMLGELRHAAALRLVLADARRRERRLRDVAERERSEAEIAEIIDWLGRHDSPS